MKLKKLNIKGFSHVELFVLIVAVVAVSSVGYYVAKNRNTSHAGSWQTMASTSNSSATETLYACIQKTSSNSWLVKGQAIISPQVKVPSSYTATLKDAYGIHATSYGLGAFTYNSATNTDIATTQFAINPEISNFISGSVSVSATNATKGGGGMSYAAGSLPSC